MTTNVAPEEPNPEAVRDGKANQWHKRTDFLLIVGLTASPIAGLGLYGIAKLFNASEWTAILTAALVVSTFVQAGIAKLQRDTMLEQMKVAKTAANAAKDTVASMRQDQRAWLVVSKPEELNKPKDRGINFSVKIKNSGHSPAFIRLQRGRLFDADIIADEMKDEFSAFMATLYASDPIEVVLAPTDEHTFHMHFDEPKTLFEMAKDLEPWKAMFVISGVVYRDPQGADHHTTVCHRYVSYEEKPRFIGHRWHNQMT